MRSYYLIILLLTTTLVLAQSTDVTVHIANIDPNTVDIGFFDGEYTFTHYFGSPATINSIILEIEYVACNDEGTEFACGARTACVTPMTCSDLSKCTPGGECSEEIVDCKPLDSYCLSGKKCKPGSACTLDMDGRTDERCPAATAGVCEKTGKICDIGSKCSEGAGCTPSGKMECKPIPDVQFPTLSFPIKGSVSTIEIAITGDRAATDGDDVRILKVERDKGAATTLTKTLLSLRGNGPIFLGLIKEIVDAKNQTGTAYITSTNPEAPAWFDDGSGTSSTNRNTTTIYGDRALACLNSDENVDSSGAPKCDYKDEQDCANKGKDWLQGYCCGDYPYNGTCTWYPERNAVCGNTGLDWKWAAIEDVGVITQLGGDCPNVQLVSNGAKFYTCNDDVPSPIPSSSAMKLSGKTTIQGHEYFCEGENLIECGGDNPYSSTAKKTGASMTFNDTLNYCTSDGKWVTSLDASKDSCTKAGFIWTGTKCCGEAEDNFKTYEDPYTGGGKAGGCYNNLFIASGTTLGSDNKIMNYRGKFYLCDPTLAINATMPESSPLFAGTNVTPTARGPCGQPLANALLTGTKPNIICMPSTSWYFTGSTDYHVSKSTIWIPIGTEQKLGCCPDNQCWDGTNCKNSGEYYSLQDKGYRCQGTPAIWTEVPLRRNWDAKSTGFCLQDSQCLVSNAFNEAYNNIPDRYWSELTNANKPKCINNTQYIADHYCNMGTWSSRTRLVSNQLLAVALDRSPSNFSIYCDQYDAVLNRYLYSTDYGLVTDFIKRFCVQTGNRVMENCANNICVMKAGSLVALGTTINTDISGTKSPLKTLNLSPAECDEAKINDGAYHPCGYNVWYNQNTQGIIYAPGISPMPPITPLVNDFFITPYNKLKDYVFTYVYNPEVAQYNYTFFNITPDFSQFYMAKDGYDFMYSFKQKNMTLTQIDYAGWYYSNVALPAGVCERVIKSYDGRANCEQQPSPTEFYIAAHKTPPVNKFDIRQSIVDAWADTTGKMRLSP